MATRAIEQGRVSALPSVPLDAILAALADLSRPALAIIAGRAIDRMDEQDGEPDYCTAGDDDPAAINGRTNALLNWTLPGDDADAEAAWIERTDQSAPPFPVAECPADYRNAEDAEDDDPRECNGDPEREAATWCQP